MSEDIRLNPPYGGGDLKYNFDWLMKNAVAKLAFLYPFADSIKIYPAASVNYRGDADFPVKVTSGTGVTLTAITATESAATTNYTLTVTGEIPLQTAAVLEAIFGTTPTETHATVALIEVPTADYTKLTVVHNASTAVTEADGDIIEIDGRYYYVFVIGAYENTGTVTTGVTTLKITYGLKTIQYAVVVSSATLEVAA